MLYAECSKDKLWVGRVGLMVCLTERSVTPVNGADLRFCRNLIPFFLCFSNASVFVVILLKILMVVLTNGGAG